MKWVLIVFWATTGGADVEYIPMNDGASCEAAAEAVNAPTLKAGVQSAICVSTGLGSIDKGKAKPAYPTEPPSKPVDLPAKKKHWK